MRNPCCCMSVRTGALVVGILEIIIYGLWSLGVGVTLGGFIAARSVNETALEELWNKTQFENNIHPEMHVDLDGVSMMMSLYLALCLMLCAVGIVCVVGVKKIGSCVITLLGLLSVVGMVGFAVTKEGKEENPEVGAAITVLAILAVVWLVLGTVGIICSSLLVHGVLKQKPQLTTPWLILAAIAIFIGIISVFVSPEPTALFKGMVGSAFNLWFWLIVYKYKKEVEAGGDGKGDGEC